MVAISRASRRSLKSTPHFGENFLAPNPQSDADQLEAAADQAIAACGGDAREAVKALIVANHFLETGLEKLQAAVSIGYARGKLFETAKTLPRDRKDWYD
jgi:hypothetical protein